MELMKFLQQGESKAIQPRLPKPSPGPDMKPDPAAGGSDEMSPEMMDALKKMMEKPRGLHRSRSTR